MIDRPGQFDAVDGKLAARVYRAGVVDQHVDLWVAILDLGGQPADFRLGGEVGEENVDARSISSGPFDLGDRGAGPFFTPGDDRQCGAKGDECFRRRQTNAIGRAGDNHPLSADVRLGLILASLAIASLGVTWRTGGGVWHFIKCTDASS